MASTAVRRNRRVRPARLPHLPACPGGWRPPTPLQHLTHDRLALLRPPAVRPGERAIKFNRVKGVLPDAVSEGTHFLVPWLEWPIVFDVRTRPRAIKSTTGTRGA